MASDSKRQRMSNETTDDDSSDEEGETETIFRPTNFTIEIDGQQLHLNKEWLFQHSPVFKRMYEAEFQEKNMATVTLKGKTWESFEQFIRAMFFPTCVCLITEDTVLNILPLAEEYQVQDVKDRCEAFIAKSIRMAKKRNMDIDTFVEYVKFAEMFNLKTVLPLVPKQGAMYDLKSLEDADTERELSPEIKMEIFKERCKTLEPCLESFKDKEFLLQYLETLSNWPSSFKHTEALLVNTCNQINLIKSDAELVVRLIVVAEQHNLKKLLSSALMLISKWTKAELVASESFWEISQKTRNLLCK